MNKILLIGVVFIFASCKKFLETDLDVSKVTVEDVFKSDQTAQSAVSGMYFTVKSSAFADGTIRSFNCLGGLSADELRCYLPTNIAIPFETNELNSKDAYNRLMWQSMYNIIYQANMILERLALSNGVTEGVKSQLTGEAKFMRAFCHFYLVNIYGDIPLVITTNYVENGRANRTPTTVVYQQIVSDLLDAQSKMSETYVSVERVRANKYAATALLSRVYLYLNEWQKSEEQATLIINNTALYGLLPQPNNVFLKNSKEAIWQLSNLITGYNADGAALNPNNGTRNYVLTPSLLNSFESGDSRRANWVSSYTSGSDVLVFPYKYKQYLQPSPTGTTEYSMVLRLAEQYLIRAEARARQGKLTGANSAESDINIIRNRATLGNTTATTEAQLLIAIEQERRVELFSEWGHRWLDLKRWSRASIVLTPIKPLWNSNDQLYPLPLTELDANPNLKPQNPGY